MTSGSQGQSANHDLWQTSRVYQPDRQAILAALRIMLGLPKKLPINRQQDLLSDGKLSNRYVPDRTGHDCFEGPGREDTE